jgi:hypothetical protein
MPIGIRDVLVGVALAVALGSLAYSIAEHIQTDDRVTQLEDIVIGDTGKPVGEGGGMIDTLSQTGQAFVTIGQRLTDLEKAQEGSASSFRVEVLSSLICNDLADHTKFGATPIYASIGESLFCKEYLE